MYDYVTRRDWGARFKTDRRIEITSRTEYIVHHTVVGPMSHDRCDDYLRKIEDQHHRQWGYSVGYNELVCQHLVWYEGAGRDVRGQHTSNHNTYAIGIGYMGDGRTALPEGLVPALRWRWDLLSNQADRRLWLRGHRQFKATNCPGDLLWEQVAMGLIVPLPPPPVVTPSPTIGDDNMSVMNNPVLARGSNGHYVRILQGLLCAHAEDAVQYVCFLNQVDMATFIDGDFGQMTHDVLTEWQKRTQALVPDGICGPATWKWLCGEQ